MATGGVLECSGDMKNFGVPPESTGGGAVSSGERNILAATVDLPGGMRCANGENMRG